MKEKLSADRLISRITYREHINWRRLWLSSLLKPLAIASLTTLLFFQSAIFRDPDAVIFFGIAFTFFLIIFLASNLGHVYFTDNRIYVDDEGLKIITLGRTRKKTWEQLDIRWGTLNKDHQMTHAKPIRCLIAEPTDPLDLFSIAILIPDKKDFVPPQEAFASEWKAILFATTVFCLVFAAVITVATNIPDEALCAGFFAFGMGVVATAAIDVYYRQVIRDRILKKEAVNRYLPQLEKANFFFLAIVVIAAAPFLWGGIAKTIIAVLVLSPLITLIVFLQKQTHARLLAAKNSDYFQSVDAKPWLEKYILNS